MLENNKTGFSQLHELATQRASQLAALRTGREPAIPNQQDIFQATNQIIVDQLISQARESGTPIELPQASQQDTAEGQRYARAQADLLLKRATAIIEQDGTIHSLNGVVIRPSEGYSEVVQWSPEPGKIRQLNYGWIKIIV